MNCPFGFFVNCRKKRIAPLEKNPTIEIRSSRYLRIQHFNAYPRDDKFEKEMQMYIQYRYKGMPVSGPFEFNRKFSNIEQEETLEQSHLSPQSVLDPTSPYEAQGSANTATASQVNNVDRDLVIFLIHGVGGSSDIWSVQTRYFSDLGYEVIAPDLIGHGFSCTPREAKAYHFREIAADIVELFDKYCKRKNVLIGHSYGGAFHNKHTSVVHMEEAFNIPAHVLQHTMNGQVWPDGDELYHKWITCPSLLIYGAQDQLVSLQEEEDMMKVMYGSKLEVIEDAGHMVMIEEPDEVNRLISEFISY